MQARRRWAADPPLLLVIVIWVVVLVDAIRQGLAVPESELLARLPAHATTSFVAFAVLAPSVLVAMNYFMPMHGKWFDWPKRLVDRWLGDGTADSFWMRLQPLWLMSIGSTTLGATGYIVSEIHGSASAASLSSLFIGFGAGFAVGALLDQFVLRRQTTGQRNGAA